MVSKYAIEVLLVEDNPYDAELIINSLREQNLVNDIRLATDGADALDYLFQKDGSLRRERPMLILLDLKLPKVSGLEVLRQIKTNEQAKEIPMVVLTSSNQESDIEECYKWGVNSFVTKPVEFEFFAKAVTGLGHYWLLLNKLPSFLK